MRLPKGARYLARRFKYTEQIRRLIFTTNAIEGFRRQVRMVTKTKGALPSGMALLKRLCHSHQNANRKSVMPHANLGCPAPQLATWFGDRMKLHLK